MPPTRAEQDLAKALLLKLFLAMAEEETASRTAAAPGSTPVWDGDDENQHVQGDD